MLLEHGADVFLQNGNGQTAVEIAMEHGHTDVVRLLEVEQTRAQERKRSEEEARKSILQRCALIASSVWRFWTGRGTMS